MIDFYKKVVFENYANFKGRASRSEYWYFTLMHLLIVLTLAVVDRAIGLKIGIFGMIYGFAIFLPGMAVSVRRMHDVGKSGWLLLASYVVMVISMVVMFMGVAATFMGSAAGPISVVWGAVAGLVFLANSIYMLVLFCTKSNEGNNKYGPNPFGEENELDLLGTE